MISKKQAAKLLEQYQETLLNTQVDVNLFIEMAAASGSSYLSFFYEKKNSVKLKKVLRDKGFYLETLTFRSSPEQERITIIWDSSILSSIERSGEIE
jgi:hypothetical protein